MLVSRDRATITRIWTLVTCQMSTNSEHAIKRFQCSYRHRIYHTIAKQKFHTFTLSHFPGIITFSYGSPRFHMDVHSSLWISTVYYGSAPFLSSGGTSTGADVDMWVCLSLQKIGFETAEARLATGYTIQVYSDKATVQVYSNSTNS